MQTTSYSQKELTFFEDIINNDGPTPDEYPILNQWFKDQWQRIQRKEISSEDLKVYYHRFSQLYQSADNLFGHATIWPHGYPGDYEIIDKMYTYHISRNPKYQKWDKYFHSFSAPRAVNNRKAYIKNTLKQLDTNAKVLNLASGPCRDLLEFFEENPRTHMHIDCVEIDQNAIKYAKNLLKNYIKQVKFFHQNVFKFQTTSKYDLIWSAGLFDYFNDQSFVEILNHFHSSLKENGQIIIGNIHPRNPSRPVMEFSQWCLHHRTETELVELAIKAGIKDYSKIIIEQEAEGVNLFLKIKK